MPVTLRPHLLPGILLVVAAASSTRTPWPLVLLTLWSLTAALATRRPLATSLALAVVLHLGGVLVIGLTAPFLPGGLLAMGVVAQILVIGISSVLRPGSWTATAERLRGQIGPFVAALALPVGIGVAAVARGTGYTWALWNDAAVQLDVARATVLNGGVVLGSGQPDPVVTTALGWAMSAQRSGRGPSLVDDGSAQAVFTFAVIALLGVLMAVVVARAVPPGRRVLRTVAAALGAVIAWSWFVSGFAVPYGFLNSLVALAVIAASWLLWVDAPARPRETLGGLAVAAAVLLGTWPLLVVVPVLLGVVVGVANWREMRTRPMLPTWAMVPIVLGFLALCAVLAIPMSTGPGGSAGAAADGAFFVFRPHQPVLISVVALLAAGAAWRWGKAGWESLGVPIVLAGGVVGLAYFAVQRERAGGALWYYYPQKLAWMVCAVLLVTTASLVFRLLVEQARTRRDGVLVPVVVVVVVGAAAALVPPSSASLVGGGSWGAARVLPALTLTTGPGDRFDSYRAFDPVRDLAESIESRSALTVVAGDLGVPLGDVWVNDLNLTARSHGLETTLRRDIDAAPLTEAAGVCDLADDWGSVMVVLTDADGLADAVSSACPEAGVTFEDIP